MKDFAGKSAVLTGGGTGVGANWRANCSPRAATSRCAIPPPMPSDPRLEHWRAQQMQNDAGDLRPSLETNAAEQSYSARAALCFRGAFAISRVSKIPTTIANELNEGH